MNERTKLSLESIIARNENVPSVDLDGEIGMMSIDNGKYYGLDSVGSAIWELLSTPITIQEIIQNLLKEYDVGRNTCEEDVTNFLYSMLNEKLIKVIEK